MKLLRKTVYMFLLPVIFCLGGCAGKDTISMELSSEGQNIQQNVEETAADDSKKPSEDEEMDEGICFVYICGAVKKPGVYEMKAGSRIYEVVALAGGLLENAAPNGINQAETVTDGQMIEILTIEEQQQAKSAAAADGNPLVNINTASAEELMTLSGIGQAKAENIIAYREAHGNFTAIEEILSVNGIGEGVYAKIRDKITT